MFLVRNALMTSDNAVRRVRPGDVWLKGMFRGLSRPFFRSRRVHLSVLARLRARTDLPLTILVRVLPLFARFFVGKPASQGLSYLYVDHLLLLLC